MYKLIPLLVSSIPEGGLRQFFKSITSIQNQSRKFLQTCHLLQWPLQTSHRSLSFPSWIPSFSSPLWPGILAADQPLCSHLSFLKMLVPAATWPPFRWVPAQPCTLPLQQPQLCEAPSLSHSPFQPSVTPERRQHRREELVGGEMKGVNSTPGVEWGLAFHTGLRRRTQTLLTWTEHP